MHTMYSIKIHQYRVQILYKPGPEIFIADWLLQHNHEEGKDKPIRDMDIRVDTIQVQQIFQGSSPFHKFRTQWCRMTISNI